METQIRQRWQMPPLSMADVIRYAQGDAADRLLEVIGTGGFHRARYQGWLAIESAACRIAALSFEAVADWHRADDALRATALAWADQLRSWVLLAATDVRRLDGVAMATPEALAAWHAFHLKAVASQRVGEALGAAVLQACLFQGPGRGALEALRTLPFTRTASGYVLARLDDHALDADREALLDAYSNTALIAGAQRGAEWMREAFLDVFATQPR